MKLRILFAFSSLLFFLSGCYLTPEVGHWCGTPGPNGPLAHLDQNGAPRNALAGF